MVKFVYGLVDPVDPGHVRYVGMAVSNSNRPYNHLYRARLPSTKRSHLINWIRKVQSQGRECDVITLEALSDDASPALVGFVERCYIQSLREIGHELTNISEGGEGRTGKHTPEALEAMRSAHQTPEMRAFHSATNKGRVHTGQALQNIQEAQRRPEVRAKAREIALQRPPMGEAQRAKISARWKGTKRDAQFVEHLREVMTGKVRTPETKEKISSVVRQTWAERTPEQRAAITAKRAATIAAKRRS